MLSEVRFRTHISTHIFPMIQFWLICFVVHLHSTAGRLIVIDESSSPPYIVLVYRAESSQGDQTLGFGSLLTNTVVVSTCGVLADFDPERKPVRKPLSPKETFILLPRLPINQGDIKSKDRRMPVVAISIHSECSLKGYYGQFNDIAMAVMQRSARLRTKPPIPIDQGQLAPLLPLFSVNQLKLTLYFLEQIRTNSSCSFFAYYGPQYNPSYLKELETFIYTASDVREVVCGLKDKINYQPAEDYECKPIMDLKNPKAFDPHKEIVSLPLDPIWGDCPIVSHGTPLMCYHPGSSPDHRHPYRYAVSVLGYPLYCNRLSAQNWKPIKFDRGPVFIWQRLDQYFSYIQLFNPDLIYMGRNYSKVSLKEFDSRHLYRNAHGGANAALTTPPGLQGAIFSVVALFFANVPVPY